MILMMQGPRLCNDDEFGANTITVQAARKGSGGCFYHEEQNYDRIGNESQCPYEDPTNDARYSSTLFEQRFTTPSTGSSSRATDACLSSFPIPWRSRRLSRLVLVGLALFCLFSNERVVQADTDAATTTANFTNGTDSSPYIMIIDGGSTGSRLHIFEFMTSTVERRGSFRTELPLSAYAAHGNDPDTDDASSTLCVDHVQPLLEGAARTIPAAWHRSTPLYYAATAGMRLVSLEQQEAVYDAVFQCLVTTTTTTTALFDVQPFHIATLSGELEGYYGAVAANYLLGTVLINMTLATSTRLSPPQAQPIPKCMDDCTVVPVVVGALDMGGSSTQMVFYHPPYEARTVELDSETTAETCAQKLQPDHFFSTSYLSYGVDQMRERLWQLLIQETATTAITGSHSTVVANPCSNPGYTTLVGNNVELIGTGDAELCTAYLRRLIRDSQVVDPTAEIVDLTTPRNYTVGGIQHPPVQGRRFLAMSLYFFAFDFLRVQSGDAALEAAWPTPTLDELSHAVGTVCSWDWISQMIPLDGTHRYTRASVLPHRCFEAVYMITLLRHGFGFDPQSRDITYAFDVNESEVEWTLGMALQLRVAKQSDPRPSGVPADTTQSPPQCVSSMPESSEAQSPLANANNNKNMDEASKTQSPVCSQNEKQENSTFEKDDDERRSRWVQMVAEVLVSDGELFSSRHLQ